MTQFANILPTCCQRMWLAGDLGASLLELQLKVSPAPERRAARWTTETNGLPASAGFARALPLAAQRHTDKMHSLLDVFSTKYRLLRYDGF